MNHAAFSQLLLLGALWGAAFMFMRIAAPEFGAIALAGTRIAIAAAVMLLLVVMLRERTHFRSHWKKYLVIGAVNTAIPFVAYSFAALHVPAGYSAIANSTTPIWVALVAVIWFKESLPWTKWLGVMCAFAGVVALVGLQPVAITPMVITGMIACLGAAAMYATASFLIKRYLSDVPGITGANGMVWGALVWLAIPALLAAPAQRPSTSAWVAVATLALLCTAFAYVVFFHLIKTIGPQRASSVAFLFPAFAAMWGWLILDEPITTNMLIGMGLVFVGTALVSRSHGRVASAAPTAWQRIRDTLLVPFVFAWLPTALQRCLVSWVTARADFYAPKRLSVRANLPRFFPTANLDAAVAQIQLTELTDHGDLWVSLRRSDAWMQKNLRVDGPSLPLTSPALFITFHFGGGWWMTRFLRSQGMRSSIVMRRGRAEDSLIGRFIFKLGQFRMAAVERACGALLIVTEDGNAAREVLRAWKQGTSVIALVDLPPPLVDRSEAVTFLDRVAYFPSALFHLAHRMNVPVYAYVGGWDITTMTPNVRLVQLHGTSPLESLQDAVSFFEHELKQNPGSWHAWGDIDLYFEAPTVCATPKTTAD